VSVRFPNQTTAKQFFIDRIVAQASKEGVPLSEIERRMLAWSEAEMTPADAIELQSRFEKETTDSEFERKISTLVKQAYKEDLARDATVRKLYLEAFRVLNQGDHYILIMIKPALGPRAEFGSFLNALGFFFKKSR
jgi:hypothetical protein